MYKVRTTEEIGVECVKCGAVTAGMHMCYERPGPVTALNAAAVIGYDKWSRDRGGGGAAPGADASWAGRDRERDRERERERQARAHQMSHVHAAEPDASSLFPAPIRVNGNRDRLSQQLHNKLGDYQLAQALLDDPSKSIGICAEPQSPAPCPPSRRESEFKKPAHAPQNGRVHHRQHMYSKNEATGPTSAPAHRPPNLKINGFQTQIDSSQPPIESILKEMKSLPIPLSGMAATPRKEQEDKFVFNHALNRLVQDNSQSNDLKTPIAKPGFDSRISNSRISLSPDVNKDLGLSESEDEIGGPTTRLEPLRSPIGSGSPSSGSESSDTETETSSGESVTPDAATAQGGGAPAPRSSWSLSNFAPPAAQPAGQPQPYDALAKELRHALADVKGKATSPISDMSDSESSSASPAARRRRAPALSSDDDNHASPRRQSSQPPAAKRGRPPSKAAAKPSEPPKKRGRPRKQRPAPPAPAPPPAAPPAPDSEPETEPAPAHPQALIDTKTQIFRRVFTPKKGDEGGGKGGKGGKGKGGKGKGQVTIIEVTAPETNVDDDSRRRRESAERRSEEAMSRLSPPHQPLPVRLATDRSPRDRSPRDRATERTSNDRISSERTERISDRVPDRIPSDRGPDRISDRVPDRTASDRISDRIPSERLTNDRTPSDRLVDRIPSDRPRIPSERMTDRMPSERMSNDRTPSERTGNDRIPERPSTDRLPTNDRVSAKMSTSDRLTVDRVKSERHTDRLSMDRLPGDRAPSPRDKAGDRFVRAEADVGPATEASSNVSSRRRRAAPDRRPRLMVRLPLARLSAAARRALREPAPAPRRLPALPLLPALPHLPHLPLMPQQIASAAPLAPRGTSGSSGSSGSGGAGQTPIYYSYFERLPADALSDEERDHKFYLCEATRLRSAAEREQEPLNRVMLYLESVLCFVLTGRVLELELDTKRAFTIYRETIEYIKSIHSMPQRFRASPHSTFSKLDILSLRVQALLYLRMFKMYNREVKEYYKIVQDYQQKVNVPACAESVSPLSPTPSPAGSVGSVGSGSAGSGASASSGYCSLAHAVPAHAHHALLQLNKYYTFLYVAFELWEQADCLCRLRPNQDLFIAVDRKCGPLTLFSTFRHLVQYVRHAISLLKNAPRE